MNMREKKAATLIIIKRSSVRGTFLWDKKNTAGISRRSEKSERKKEQSITKMR